MLSTVLLIFWSLTGHAFPERKDQKVEQELKQDSLLKKSVTES